MKRFKTTSDLIRSALHDAIRDRQTYADCWDKDAPERKEALQEVAEYKAYLKKRFNSRTIEDYVGYVSEVTLDELRKRNEST